MRTIVVHAGLRPGMTRRSRRLAVMRAMDRQADARIVAQNGRRAAISVSEAEFAIATVGGAFVYNGRKGRVISKTAEGGEIVGGGQAKRIMVEFADAASVASIQEELRRAEQQLSEFNRRVGERGYGGREHEAARAEVRRLKGDLYQAKKNYHKDCLCDACSAERAVDGAVSEWLRGHGASWLPGEDAGGFNVRAARDPSDGSWVVTFVSKSDGMTAHVVRIGRGEATTPAEAQAIALRRLETGRDRATRDYITSSGGKFTVHSESGKPMGTYGTRAEAEKRLREIEYFKHNDAGRTVVKYTAVTRGDGKFYIKVRAYENGRMVGGDDNRMPWPNEIGAVLEAERRAKEVNNTELGGRGTIEYVKNL